MPPSGGVGSSLGHWAMRWETWQLLYRATGHAAPLPKGLLKQQRGQRGAGNRMVPPSLFPLQNRERRACPFLREPGHWRRQHVPGMSPRPSSGSGGNGSSPSSHHSHHGQAALTVLADTETIEKLIELFRLTLPSSPVQPSLILDHCQTQEFLLKK